MIPSAYLCGVFLVFEELNIQDYTRREGVNIAT